MIIRYRKSFFAQISTKYGSAISNISNIANLVYYKYN